MTADLPLIGPHEGIELELMLTGRKTVAYFAECVPLEKFQPYVSSGEIGMYEWTDHKEILISVGCPPEIAQKLPTCVIYYLNGHAHVVDVLKAAFIKYYHSSGTESAFASAEIGRILGYPEKSVAEFLRRQLE